jgi:hypothetical protein
MAPPHAASRPNTASNTPTGQGSWKPYSPSSGAGEKRVREHRYETSDTRSSMGDELAVAGTSGPMNYQTQLPLHQHSQNTVPHLQQQHQLQHAPAHTQQYMNPNAMNQLNMSPTFDMSFDVGGVTFDGLEMLQGFTGVEAAANFWNSLTPGYAVGGGGGLVADGAGGMLEYAQMPGSAHPSNNGWVSAQGTPSSGAGGQAGYSPQAWAAGGSVQGGSGVGTVGPQGQGGLQLESAEFWSQVAGNSFDWQADPAVPFNI